MGRQVRRVALDFDWPLNTVWKGFLAPEEIDALPCHCCDQSGLNPQTLRLHEDWYDNGGNPGRWWYDYKTGIDGLPTARPPWKVFGETRRWMYELTQDEVDHLIAEGRLNDYVNTWDGTQGKWVRDESKPWPTAERINRDMQFGMGHDSINAHICVRFRAERLGFYGLCEHCHGKGYTYRDAEHRAAAESWEPTDPPAGEGWQMWETVSEGSPISPVMQSPEQLAEWLAESNAGALGRRGASFEAWMKMIDAGWAPTAVASGGEVRSGVEALQGRDEGL